MASRKAGLISKILGTMVWGTIVATVVYFQLPDSFWGIDRPPLGTFVTLGLFWPVIWGCTWLSRVILPLPFELLPWAIELITVGPGHFIAWLILGREVEDDDDDD